MPARGLVPFDGYNQLLSRRFEEAIDIFLANQKANGPSDAISSALAAAYHDLGFQTLANQVRRSVRSVSGNQWTFRVGHPADQPLRIRPELLARSPADGSFPILSERTPVRMDLSHSAWSDIFFLGMDFPEGARVLNVSIDLAVHGRDKGPKPPVEAYLRVIDEPVLRLVSVDLGARTDLTSLPGSLRFRQGLSGPAQGGRHRIRHRPAGHRRLRPEPGRPAGASRRSGLRIGDRQQRQQHPQGLAAGGFDESAGIAHFGVHARDGAGQVSDRHTGGERATDRAGPRHSRPNGSAVPAAAGRIPAAMWPGIKLITGTLAAQGDPELGISRGRPAPQASHPLFRGCLPGSAPATAGQPGASAWRDGPECRADPRDGHREVSAAQRERVESAPASDGDSR